MSGPSPAPQDLLAAGALLADRGVFGLAWLDSELLVETHYGSLASMLRVGAPAAVSLPPLYGYEDEIAALKDHPGRVLELPAVTIQRADGTAPRLNLTLIHAPLAGRTLLLIARTSVGNDLELQLSQQIRDRLILESEARALAHRLERANRDLEEFASIISHDLRTPMRAMRYLTEDAEAALGDDPAHAATREKLARVREQSQRLTAMLGALFDYSRAGQKQDVVQTTDLSALVRTIISRMPVRPGVTVEITGTWPTLDTLAAPLDLVIRNLIDNAIKHHDRAAMHIRIAAADHGACIEISVGDDGPGIDPRHHAIVFQPFRQLSTKDTTDGGGMGLALVKRTVEAVGGRLELISDPSVGRGATFKVHWPRAILP